MDTVVYWITIAGTILGFAITSWTFYELFKKDKDKERKLNYLEKQVEQLEKQTLIQEENSKIFKEQLEISKQKMQKEDDRTLAILKIENVKRKDSIKPRFEYANASTGISDLPSDQLQPRLEQKIYYELITVLTGFEGIAHKVC